MSIGDSKGSGDGFGADYISGAKDFEPAKKASKYKVGDPARIFGDDEFAEGIIEAKDNKWIDANGCFTELGVEEMTRRENELSSSSGGGPDHDFSNFKKDQSKKITFSASSTHPKFALPVSSTARGADSADHLAK